jgi:2-oxoglutarate ferredoxin oxidoreductase subunit beta
VATGLVLSNPELKVVVEVGDGDAYGIGLGHFAHSCRRNIDLTVIAHDNQIYGLTTGQASPTTEQHMATVSTPAGVLEQPVNTIGLAVAEGATFVARGFTGDVPHLTGLMTAALEHRGFALVDVFQPCAKALELSLTTFHDMSCTPEQCKIPLGVIYREEGRPTYSDGLPQLTGPLWKTATAPRDISATLASMT